MLQSLHLNHPPITTTSPSSPNPNPMNPNPSKRPITDSTDEPTKRRNIDDDHKEKELDYTLDDQQATAESSGLRLLGLLLQCAEHVAVDNLDQANNLLPEISELSSPFGSSPERVAAYFAEALQARIITSYLANQAIFQALEDKETAHIIDLDIMQGLQWPGLFHILASRPRKIKSIRLTGIGSSIELLEATGLRLHEFANSLNLPFEFVPLEHKIGNVSSDFVDQLGIRANETVVVHWLHHCLYDVTGSDYGTLRLLKTLKPKLVTIVEQDLSHAGSFLNRFVEALHYYSALFDAVGDGVEPDNVERFTVERQLFGSEIKNIVAVGGPKRTGEVKVERWGEELGRVGFRPVSLAGNPAAQASLLLGMFPWKGYTLVEETGRLKLGWKDLSLLTASAWEPSDLD